MVIDFENSQKGAGIFRAPAEIHLDPNYQSEIKNEIKYITNKDWSNNWVIMDGQY